MSSRQNLIDKASAHAKSLQIEEIQSKLLFFHNFIF